MFLENGYSKVTVSDIARGVRGRRRLEKVCGQLWGGSGLRRNRRFSRCAPIVAWRAAMPTKRWPPAARDRVDHRREFRSCDETGPRRSAAPQPNPPRSACMGRSEHGRKVGAADPHTAGGAGPAGEPARRRSIQAAFARLRGRRRTAERTFRRVLRAAAHRQGGSVCCA